MAAYILVLSSIQSTVFKAFKNEFFMFRVNSVTLCLMRLSNKYWMCTEDRATCNLKFCGKCYNDGFDNAHSDAFEMHLGMALNFPSTIFKYSTCFQILLANIEPSLQELLKTYSSLEF